MEKIKMKEVFSVWYHDYDNGDGSNMLEIFSTKEKAKSWIDRYIIEETYDGEPLYDRKGFEIIPYTIDPAF
jgi:hypothetical protein